MHRPITIPEAHAFSAIVAFSYVIALYIFPSARSKPWQTDDKGRRLDRLHPVILKARLYAISYSAISSVLLVAVLLEITSEPNNPKSIYEIFDQTLSLTGFKSSTIPTFSLQYLRLLIQPIVLTAILYWGTIYNRLFLEPKSISDNQAHAWKDGIDIYVIRALILGPLLEEIVYRGCIIAFHLLVSPQDRLSKTRLIFTSPLWFGLAHVHHIWETYITLGRTKQALITATLQTVIQFIYTTIFGWYATFIHLRTGSVIAAVLCHSFCNYMGLPPLLRSLQQFPNKRSSIMIHYLIGLMIFSFLLTRWASNHNLFPNSRLWMSLKNVT